MITKAEADKLRRLIGAHTSARCEAEHAGAQTPGDAVVIRNHAREATKKLARYIRELEGKEDPEAHDSDLIG